MPFDLEFLKTLVDETALRRAARDVAEAEEDGSTETATEAYLLCSVAHAGAALAAGDDWRSRRLHGDAAMAHMVGYLSCLEGSPDDSHPSIAIEALEASKAANGFDPGVDLEEHQERARAEYNEKEEALELFPDDGEFV